MAASISEQDVRRVARLARLHLTADDVHRFAAQLAEVLAYADQVQQVDASQPGTDGPSAPAGMPLRDDEVRPGLSRQEAMANAPDADREGGYFTVPRVLG